MSTINSQTDFNVITSQKELQEKNIYLQAGLSSHGRSFELHCVAALRFYYTDGSKQVNIVNGLLAIAYNSRMAGSKTLAKWLGEAIPHKLEKGDVSKAPRFGKKLKDAEYFTPEQLDAFLWQCPQWHKFKRAADKKVFDEKAYAKTVAKALVKNNCKESHFHDLLVDALREELASKKEAA